MDHAATGVVGMVWLQKHSAMLFPYPELAFFLLQNSKLAERREQHVGGPRIEIELPRHDFC